MMRRLVLLGLLLLLSAAVQAQTVTQVIVTTYLQGTNNLAQPAQPLNMSGFQCGQKPKVAKPSGTVNNPTRVVVDDPMDPTADCIFADSVTANGPLFSLPFGAAVYEVTMKYVNSVAASPESARSNLFTRPGAAPAAPTGTRIVRLLLSGKTVFGFRTRRAPAQFLYLVGDQRNR
jgi:hypothetical protein